jgi:subtilisin family serine protease
MELRQSPDWRPRCSALMWDRIAWMECGAPGGSWKSRTRLRLTVLVLVLWGLAGVSFSSGYQQEQETATPEVQATDTELPSETPASMDTGTPVPAPTETAPEPLQPIYTEPPSSTIEPTTTEAPSEIPSVTPTDVPTATTESTRTELPAPTIPPTHTPAPSYTTAPSFPIEATSILQPAPPMESPTTGAPPPVQLSGDYVPDEVLIRFRRRAEQEAVDQCLQIAGASIESEIEALAVYVLKVPAGAVAQSIASLAACPEVRLVEPNYISQAADTIPSDPGWGLQYGLVNIRAPQGWDISTGSSAVTIAIVDTGVDLGHPDLAAKIVPGFDFVNGDPVPQDDNGHGTHVAGIAAAITNNGAGVAGVSWGARIMPVKVLDASGSGTFANVAAGIVWAADHGAQVINLSLGADSASSVLEDAVNYAYSKGVILVAAAGNFGGEFVLYPARYPHVIAVAATDNTNDHAYFSNFGPEIDVSAPGVSIYSTELGGVYGYHSGTSMSTPYVSGLAAILRGLPGSSGSPDLIAKDMESTALDLGLAGPDELYGYGLIQIDGAIRAALSLPAPHRPGLFHQPGAAIFTSTFTPSPTATGTSATPTETPAASTQVPYVPPTAGLGAQQKAIVSTPVPPAPARGWGNDWQLAGGGVVLVLMGFVLASDARRRHVRPGRRGPYFKFP